MSKGKFAGLIMLSAFSAGVASSSAVSARADENLASVVEDDKGASSQDDSVTTDFKFSDESVSVSDENNIYLKQQTDEETQDDSTDGSSNERNDAENLDKNIENKTDLPESSAKENSKNGDYLFFDDDKKQNVKKIRMVKGLTVAGIGAITEGSATSVISKFVKSSKNDKKDEPSPDPTPESNNPNNPDDDVKHDDNVKHDDDGTINGISDLPIVFRIVIFITLLVAFFVVLLFLGASLNKLGNKLGFWRALSNFIGRVKLN